MLVSDFSLSSFPPLPEFFFPARYDNWATLHILVAVGRDENERRQLGLLQGKEWPGSYGAVASAPAGSWFEKEWASEGLGDDGDNPLREKISAGASCLLKAGKEYASNKGAGAAGGGPVFPLYFEFKATRLKASVAERWGGADGGAAGAWLGSLFGTRVGSEQEHGALSKGADVDFAHEHNVFLGDIPITCDAAHAWPGILKQTKMQNTLAVNDVFELSHTLHYVVLQTVEPSLIRVLIARHLGGASGPVTADLVKLTDKAVVDGDVDLDLDIDMTFEPVEGAILPFGVRQRMIAAELKTPGTYVVRVKTPFLPIGTFYSCRAVKLRLQLSAAAFVGWDAAKSCAGSSHSDMLKAESQERKLKTSFTPEWMENQVGIHTVLLRTYRIPLPIRFTPVVVLHRYISYIPVLYRIVPR